MKDDILIGNGKSDYHVVIVTGTCRAGKTLLSQVLATAENVQWIEEPYAILLLTILTMQGQIPKQSGEKILLSLCKELFNDTILLRKGNFRPEDLSSIWKVKDANEIFDRLVNVKSRDDVKAYLKERHTIFLLDLPEVVSGMKLFNNIFSDLSVLHVVRDGYEVAREIARKGWYTLDNLKNPTIEMPCWKYIDPKSNDVLRLPWWLQHEEAEEFLASTDYERGLYYWHDVLTFGTEIESMNDNIVIRYEDFTKMPQVLLENLFGKLGLKITTKTVALISEIHASPVKEVNINLSNMSNKKQQEIGNLRRMYGYKRS